MLFVQRLAVVCALLGFSASSLGCDQLGLGSSSDKAKKEKKKSSSDDDDEDDEPKKKKKKKKQADDESAEEVKPDGDKSAKKEEAPPPPPTEKPIGEAFAGKYRSTFGDARFSQAGSTITATYPGGTMSCEATDKSLACDWKDSAGKGKAKLDKQPTGDLKGTWGFGMSTSDGGMWLFTLLEAGEPGPTGEEAQAGAFDGVYFSTWGDTVFKEDGNKVTGTYPGGKLDCTKSGANLDCDWKDSAGTGKAKLTRQLNGNVSGSWGFRMSATDGGTWLFRKK